MIINQNIPALQNLNELNSKSKNVAKDMQTLASGKRINQAADDAAGMTISQKMKAQIKGLKQASQNIEDGISLVNTAESALGNIQNPNLQRMRELAVQAANDTLSKEDRQTIQKEIDEIKGNIRGIAENTEFNTRQLLAPSKVGDPDKPTTGGGKADVVFFIDDSGSMSEQIDMVKDGIESFAGDLSAYGDVRIGTVSTLEENTGRTMALTEDIEEVKNHLDSVHVANGGATSYPYQKMMDYAPDGNQAEDLSYANDSNKVFVLLTDTGDESDLLSNDVDQTTYPSQQEVRNKLDQHQIFSYVFGVEDRGTGDNTFDDESEYDQIADEMFIPETTEDISQNISPELSDKIINDTDLGEPAEELNPIKLQVGPNNGDKFTIELFDARPENLGIGNVKVDPQEKANEAIALVDEAIQKVSEQRSKFGSYENALEHTLNNVTNAEVQLTKSRSKIKDADMASEVMSLNQHKVQLQAAMSMFTQANQNPQSLLQFLE
ncbi:flagellin [Alkalibacillus flavidus]|uniref:Flagellin n=1 Tax=Alkalibacillus flavidus TaxID=546021 RepID=A0ABV2KU42_9BACI